MVNDARTDNQGIPADVKAWAAEVLELPTDGGTGRRKAHLLRRLDEADLVPPPAWDEAVRVLSERASRGTWIECYRADALARQVDAFIQEFLALSPAERRARCDALLASAETAPALRMHLERLKRGVDVVPAFEDDANPLVSKFGSLLCELFVALPAARASRRREALAETLDRSRDWLKAAKEFPRRYPEIVALDAVNFEVCRDFLTRVRKSRGPTFQSKRPLARESISDRTWGVIFFFLLMLFLVLAFVVGPHESHRQRHTYPYRGGYAPVPNAIGERIRIERIMRERIQRIMHAPPDELTDRELKERETLMELHKVIYPEAGNDGAQQDGANPETKGELNATPEAPELPNQPIKKDSRVE